MSSQPLLPRLQAELAKGVQPIPLGETLGYQIESLQEGVAVIVMETSDRHGNAFGYTHGGAICSIVDSAIGMAALTVLEEGETTTTVELKVNFVRPVWHTTLRAIGKVVKKGRTLTLLDCEVVDPQQRLVAKASGTCMTLRGPQADGRHPEAAG